MKLGGLLVGLGNPGAEYANTRHNYGFLVIDALLRECEQPGLLSRLSGKNDPYALWKASIADAKGNRADWLLATPFTYMNRSGEAVQRIASYYRIAPEATLILHDELDLPFGRMRLKKGGGNAGHNGLKSIQQMLGTADFYRLRLGVGKPVGHDGASWVIGCFHEEEQKLLPETISAAVRGVFLYIREGERAARQFCNSFALPPEHS